MKQVEVLISRNALAEDEAQYLSQMNAEILSHANPNQKIYYVDRIRRELAETKQVCYLANHCPDLCSLIIPSLACYHAIR